MIFGLVSGFGLTQGTTDIGVLVAPVMLNMILYYFVLKDSRRNGGEKNDTSKEVFDYSLE